MYPVPCSAYPPGRAAAQAGGEAAMLGVTMLLCATLRTVTHIRGSLPALQLQCRPAAAFRIFTGTTLCVRYSSYKPVLRPSAQRHPAAPIARPHPQPLLPS